MSENVFDAIDRTRIAIEENASSRWIIGFSGGKDSTAVLKIFVSALRKAKVKPRDIDLIYCDTGVENPLIDSYVKELTKQLTDEFNELSIPINVRILTAPISERFFVKVAGRGYPTPTNSFRWCTKSLRINPVSRFIQASAQSSAIVVLGIRKDESQQRKRSVEKHGGGYWQTQRESKYKYDIFLPILDLSVPDVWDAVFMLGSPKSVDAKLLERIYSDASGECPVIKSPDAPPCASGRFGCWTCTVVRKDKSAIKLVAAGHVGLEPYLELRNWLSEFRNDTDERWAVRRNGVERPGPFKISARREILRRVRVLEETVGSEIICVDELAEIKRLWALDYEREEQMGFGQSGLVPSTC